MNEDEIPNTKVTIIISMSDEEGEENAIQSQYELSDQIFSPEVYSKMDKNSIKDFASLTFSNAYHCLVAWTDRDKKERKAYFEAKEKDDRIRLKTRMGKRLLR